MTLTLTVKISIAITINFKALLVCVKINDKAFVAFLLWQDDITHLLHRDTTVIF